MYYLKSSRKRCKSVYVLTEKFSFLSQVSQLMYQLKSSHLCRKLVNVSTDELQVMLQTTTFEFISVQNDLVKDSRDKEIREKRVQCSKILYILIKIFHSKQRELKSG